MGRRGPKPTPTALLKMRGSWRANDRTGEPAVDAELPPCPEWLQGAARQHWGEVGAMLDGLGIMGRPHTLALALLCDALADWIAAMAASATDPLAIDVKPKAWERVLKGCREFGMTPAAITAVKSVPKPDAPNKPVMKYKLA